MNGTADSPGGQAEQLLRDALVTVGTRVGIALLIFGTDIVLARLLGPDAKGRFALVLLYSQLAALLVGWGMDSALAVVAGRDVPTARRGFANALIWSAVVGGAAVLISAWLYGIPSEGRPRGPLVGVVPNLSASQFLFGAVAIPGELLFGLGLFALLGRRRIIAYSAVRLMRRGVLLVLVVAVAAIARLSLDAALALNLVALALTAGAVLIAAARADIRPVRPSGQLLLEELRFGTRALPGTVAERLQLRADAFLVNALIGVRATGIYSVTSGLAETLWYIPNALGVVMFSRAVDPAADAGRIAAVLTRTTIATTAFAAVPAFFLGPWLVDLVYGGAFREAGDALRWILPGVVAYSAVAILSRYVVGRGRPGTATAALLIGLAVNLAANVVLIPKLGIEGAAASSSVSYGVTALLILIAFRRLSGRGLLETLLLRPDDLRALPRAAGALSNSVRGVRAGPLLPLPGGGTTAELVIGEREPGEEP